MVGTKNARVPRFNVRSEPFSSPFFGRPCSSVPIRRNIPHSILWRERKARGLSQRALAQLAGLDRTYVGSVERGERNVSIDNVERLAEALGIELADLFKRIRP
jgi:DNA-binding XRE family transcriptional regulator